MQAFRDADSIKLCLRTLIRTRRVKILSGRAGATHSLRRPRPRLTESILRGKNDAVNESLDLLAAGDWGGKHVRMEVSPEGVLLEFDFAKGSIARPVTLDAEGRFSAEGLFAREGFGPRDEDEEPERVPAVYSGAVKDESMTLTVTLAETKEEVGTFTLTRGSRGRVWKRG